MPVYTPVFSHVGTNSLPVTFPDIFTVPVLAIEAAITLPNGQDWVRVGWVQAVSSSSIGPIRGRAQRVTQGRGEFKLDVPDLPYQLRFMPKSWVTQWSIAVYERVIEPVTEPIDLDASLIYQKLLDLEAKVDAL